MINIFLNIFHQTHDAAATSIESLPTRKQKWEMECDLEKKSAICKELMSKMTIDLNVLSLFMKNQVMSNLNRTLVVTIHRNRKERETLISTSNQIISLIVDVNTIFCFGWRLRNNRLFLALTRNKRITEKDTKTSNRLAIYRITVMINIRVCTQFQERGGWK